MREKGDDNMSPALLHERTARNTTGFEVQLVDHISLSSPQPQQVPASAQQSPTSTRVELPSPAGSHTPAVSCPHHQLPTDRRSKQCQGSFWKHRWSCSPGKTPETLGIAKHDKLHDVSHVNLLKRVRIYANAMNQGMAKSYGRMWWEQQNANTTQCGNDLLP